MTGIELAPEGCVLVEVRRGEGLPRLSAVVVFEPPFWPPHSLAAVRRRKRFSAHARVVAWSPDHATLEPLVEAGFAVETIISPERALALLAAARPGKSPGSGSVWVVLSRGGAALVIVRGEDVLYSCRIEWRYKILTRPNHQLLQRYTFVAHLAPEIQRGIATVRARHGIPVDGIVTCGDLPDLRALTTPLADELGMEVETLDSLDGLDVTPSALADRAADYAPALWLATAVTALPPVDTPRRSRWWGRAAAAVIVLSGMTLTGLFLRPRPEPPATSIALPTPPLATAATAGDAAAPPQVVPLIPQLAPTSRAAAGGRGQDTLPALSSILMARDRRLAILNGKIVAEGDVVGRRRVSRIEPDTVTLSEPSGGEIRIAVQRRKHLP